MDACKGRVAVVTGAAGGGMGRSIALTLAREGAAVVVNFRSSQADAEAIVNHITGRGGQALAVQADVSDGQGCQKLIDLTISSFGRVDICIIGPGAGWHAEPPDQLDVEAVLDDARRELAPLYAMMKLLLPGMYERK